MVIARTTEGELGVLPGHAPLLGQLAPGGVVTIRTESGEDLTVAAHGGFLSVSEQGVSILAETAEIAGEIDVERAREALRRAEGAGDADAGDDQPVDVAEAPVGDAGREGGADLGEVDGGGRGRGGGPDGEQEGGGGDAVGHAEGAVDELGGEAHEGEGDELAHWVSLRSVGWGGVSARYTAPRR